MTNKECKLLLKKFYNTQKVHNVYVESEINEMIVDYIDNLFKKGVITEQQAIEISKPYYDKINTDNGD